MMVLSYGQKMGDCIVSTPAPGTKHSSPVSYWGLD